jgi:hypothetical protein
VSSRCVVVVVAKFHRLRRHAGKLIPLPTVASTFSSGCLPLHACDLATAPTSSRLPAAVSNLPPLVRPRNKAAQSSAAVLAPV